MEEEMENAITEHTQVQEESPTSDQALSFEKRLEPRKAILTFCIGGSLGAVVELVYRFITNGEIDYRANLVLSPFLVIYGVGATMLYFGTLINAHKNILRMFVFGAFACSCVEFASSLIQEFVFGSTSWDYSYMRFHINGRVSLQHAISWGVLAILWYSLLMPLSDKLIGKIPNRAYKRLTTGLAIYVLVDIVVTVLALARWSMRLEGVPPVSFVGITLDAVFSNEYMGIVFAGFK